MKPEHLLQHFERLSEAHDGIPSLRRFVLDLAVRGKLVDQDPNDEPAAALLNRISEFTGQPFHLKRQLAGQFLFELPQGWEWSRLGEITTKTGSGSTPRGGQSVYQARGIPFLRSQNVYDNGLRLHDVAYIDESTHAKMRGTALESGDLLLNITGGSIGRCCRLPDTPIHANISQHIAIIRLAVPGMRDFVHKVVLSSFFQSFVIDEQTGAGRGGLPKNRMDRIPIPVPPQAEQHRIVAKVNELMVLCDELETAKRKREQNRNRLVAASLEKLNRPIDNEEVFRNDVRFTLEHLPRLATRPAHIKQLRQAILNLAVRGRLVPPNPKDEPAGELLKRIQMEKTRLVKEGTIRKQNPQAEIDADEIPFSLPDLWAWARFGDVIHLVSGQHLQPSEYSGQNQSGPPYITGPADFGKSGLVITRYAVVRKAVAQKGQILLTVKGAGVGKTAICDLPEVAISRQLMAMTAIEWSQRFLLLATHRLAETLKESARSLIPGISRQDVDQFVFALPPLAEQHRIVAKVDELMALCDQLEAQLTITETDGRRLLEAVLHEALIPALKEAA